MTRRKKHRPGLEDLLQRYATSRLLDVKPLNGASQWRIHDSGYIAVDVWLTGKYHVVQADYHLITKEYVWRRKGERGNLPIQKIDIGRFLDKVFFMADIIEERKLVHGRSKV